MSDVRLQKDTEADGLKALMTTPFKNLSKNKRLCNREWYSEIRERHVACKLQLGHSGYCYSGDF